MKKNNFSQEINGLKINCHDPRHHQEFLVLSNIINNWKEQVSDRSWWLTQEKKCLEIFQRHGYDLQSGVWFCLISIHRHGWAGMTNATLLLAEALSRKQRQCWPPFAAIDLRRQIIEWYSTHVASIVYGLHLNSAESNMLVQLHSAVSVMLEHASALNSRSKVTLQNLVNYIHSSRLSLQKKTVSDKQLDPVPRPVKGELITQAPVELVLRPSPVPWKTRLAGSVIGIVLTLTVVGAIHWLTHPSMAILLNSIWPANPISIHWQKRLTETAASLPTINSWQEMNDQLNNLEQRLLDAEQKRIPYLTISELKTAIYKLRLTLRKGGEPALVQLGNLQNKIDTQQSISDAEFDDISRHLEALQSRLLYLKSQQ
ncbi:type VI secretion system ImpA family N-terminal domain-containing protein [Escherichia coli]